MNNDQSGLIKIRRLKESKSILLYLRFTVEALENKFFNSINCNEEEYPNYKNQTNHQLLGKDISWGVEINKKPIGLLIASVVEWQDREYHLEVKNTKVKSYLALEVLSINIVKLFQKRGIASDLINEAINWAKNNNLEKIIISVPLSRTCSQPLLSITSLNKQWEDREGPILITFSSQTKIKNLLNRLNEIEQRQKKLNNLTTSPYPQEANQELLDKLSDPKIPIWAKPIIPNLFYDELNIFDFNYSRLLFQKDRLIGWLLCHRPEKNLLRYSTAWVDDLKIYRSGLFVMLSDVITTAHFQSTEKGNQTFKDTIKSDLGYPIANGCFGFDPRNEKMRAIALKHLKPCCTIYSETRMRIKTLQTSKTEPDTFD